MSHILTSTFSICTGFWLATGTQVRERRTKLSACIQQPWAVKPAHPRGAFWQGVRLLKGRTCDQWYWAVCIECLSERVGSYDPAMGLDQCCVCYQANFIGKQQTKLKTLMLRVACTLTRRWHCTIPARLLFYWVRVLSSSAAHTLQEVQGPHCCYAALLHELPASRLFNSSKVVDLDSPASVNTTET